MNLALGRHAAAFGVTALTMMACSHNDSTAKRPADAHVVVVQSTDERRAAERRAEERRAEARAEERRAEERRSEQRAEERRSEERRTDAHVRAVGGGPGDIERTSNRTAVGRIAEARCEREVRCNGFGAHRRYESRTACIADLEADKRDELNPRTCPGGIDENQLDKCVTAIRTDQCGNPAEGWSRINACRDGNLCLK